jgi:fibronectin type 3 domain-containing protein
VSVSVSPTSASLLTGGAQQFTATVTGTSNTSVTWKATGGTISSAGLYTAPATAGSYTVTATSAADPAKSASASVSVAIPVQHRATLSWTASSAPVTGCNLYRGIQTGGPYTRLNTAIITANTFVDITVSSGETYFYVATAVSSSGVESGFSNEVVAVIPMP